MPRLQQVYATCSQVIMFDIKSNNVLLNGKGVIAKISDVGLSKIMASSNTATLLVRS